jgi:hypothetical protein
MDHHVSAVVVTYSMIDSALNNIAKLATAIPSASIILVDNSPQKYKKSSVYKAALARLPDQCTYIDNQENSRFIAYNLAFQSIRRGRVVFRTDDDEFDETITATIAKKHWQGFATTPHTFNGVLQQVKDYRRPLESCIFDYAFIHRLLPFKNEPGADWQLLKHAYDMQRPKEYDEVILYKQGHGREISA